MPPPGNDHSRLQIAVVAGLLGVSSPALVRGDTGIDLPDRTVLGCDVALLRETVAGRRMLLPQQLVLVVEIAETTLDRDPGMKRRKYAAAAIPVYWVVDGSRSVVYVHADPVEGDYAEIHTVKFGQSLAVPGYERTISVI